MQKREDLVVKTSKDETEDAGKVKIGGLVTSLPVVDKTPDEIADAGKVRLGGLSPSV